MPKHDFLSPKAISNRIKARGLQKLRWYCQLCQKQCRDENGFKCHQSSAGHRRQMELFGQNPGQVVAQYSHQFESDFMAHMRVCHPNSRVSANRVYNEFIKDKDHIHMNSTRWLSLSGFVQYLGKKGLCKIEQTPKGWFIQLVPKEDEADVRRSKRKERDVAEKQDDVRQMKEIQRQIEKAAARQIDETKITMTTTAPDELATTITELNRTETDGPISFSVQKECDEKEASKKQKLEFFAEDPSVTSQSDSSHGVRWTLQGLKFLGYPLVPERRSKGLTHLEKIHAGIKEKHKKLTLDGWVKPGIVVKVISPGLRIHGYYKQKGVIKKLIDAYIAEIEMIGTGDIVRVDQAELETVLPAVGGKLLILKGPHEDCIAELTGIDIERFSVEVRLLNGSEKGHKEWYEYEDVAKLYNQQLCS